MITFQIKKSVLYITAFCQIPKRYRYIGRMGIPGLTTFINKHSDLYLQTIELHNTYLVIDGNSIAYQLYSLYSRCNSVFGGDYDKYAYCVSEFFDELLKCNITPLVLLDGGTEDKKLKTALSRIRNKIKVASIYIPSSQRKVQFLPLFIKNVFKDVMSAKGIRFAQCMFEADNCIAAVARTLNCPVLSYDSDFYVYNVLYIPFNTMDRHIIRRSEGNSYTRSCKIFRVENLLKRFHGLDETLLPLAAVLLGNDYVQSNQFGSFFRHLKMPKIGRRKHNEQQCRIEATLKWLSQFTLQKAITEVLSKLPTSSRKTIFNQIKTIIEGYTSSSVSILLVLGFSEEYISQISSQCNSKRHSFMEKVKNLRYIRELPESDPMSSDDEDSKILIDVAESTEDLENQMYIKTLPSWFIQNFQLGKFSPLFMDMITRDFCILPVQIEDFTYPSSTVISFKIINVIYKLLISGSGRPNRKLECIYRKDRRCMVRQKLENIENVLDNDIPFLSDLPNISLERRREILNKTLNIDEQQLIGLPPEWILYIAAATYWVQNADNVVVTNCHFYSLLFSMLKNVIDRKVGFFRTVGPFEHKYSQTTQIIKKRRSNDNYQPLYSLDVTVLEAFNKIDADDCILAAPFFIVNSEIDDKLFSNAKKFNVTIVHAFAEFQTCLLYTMKLNALLGYPYPEIKVADVFNGTLLYNLHVNFQKRNDVQNYINIVLQTAPSLLRLFNVLLLRLQSIFSTAFANKVNRGKRRKSNKKAKKETLVLSDIEVSEEGDQFYDEHNPYTMLPMLK